MQNTAEERLAVAIPACAAALVLKTDPFFTAAFCLYAAGTVLYRGWTPALAALAFMGGLSILSQASASAYAFLLCGSLLASVSCESRIRCIPFVASSLVIAVFGPLEGILIYVIASAAVLALGRIEYRRCAMTASVILAVFIFGLPNATSHRRLTAREKLEDQQVIWLSPLELDISAPVLRLEAPFFHTDLVSLAISAGGVRDTLPLGMVISGSDSVPVYSGNTTVELKDPRFPVEVVLTRERKPFTHPVIHLVSAGTRNE